MSLEVAWTDGEEQAPGPQTVLAVRSPKTVIGLSGGDTCNTTVEGGCQEWGPLSQLYHGMLRFRGRI